MSYGAYCVYFPCRVRRTMLKTLKEKVQEAEINHEDPTTIVLKASKRKYVQQWGGRVCVGESGQYVQQWGGRWCVGESG